MGVVWSCYKYLSQANEAATRRRRSIDSEDAAQAPEDAQVCIGSLQLLFTGPDS